MIEILTIPLQHQAGGPLRYRVQMWTKRRGWALSPKRTHTKHPNISESNTKRGDPHKLKDKELLPGLQSEHIRLVN